MTLLHRIETAPEPSREWNDVVQDALNRIRQAMLKGRGVRLSAEEVRALSLTAIGEIVAGEDPRASRSDFERERI